MSILTYKMKYSELCIRLYRYCLILENLYNLACHISHYNAISDIIMPDGLKSPVSSDVLNVLCINGIKIL